MFNDAWKLCVLSCALQHPNAEPASSQGEGKAHFCLWTISPAAFKTSLGQESSDQLFSKQICWLHLRIAGEDQHQPPQCLPTEH